MESLEQPKIDIKEIQKRANEAAKKAYLSEIENYYTSYDSPYKKMIKTELHKQELKYNMELPDILNKINEALSAEVDKIANNAVAMSFIPMVNKALVGLDKHMTSTNLLKLIIEELEPDEDDYDGFSFSYNKHERYGWLSCELSTPDNYYEFTLHTAKDEQYQLLSLPYARSGNDNRQKMNIYKDNIKIEMPFTPNVLTDKVLSIFFKMMISNTLLKMDCDGFDEDMFPESEHCHC